MSSNQPMQPEDILGMADEEFAKLDLNTISTATGSVSETKSEEQPEVSNADGGASNPDGTQVAAVDGETANDINLSSDEQGTTSTSENTGSNTFSGVTPSAESNTDTPATRADKVEKFDSDSFVKIVTAPFKANGVEMQITDPNEAIALMQKGLNYTAKMQSLAEPRRLHKMLSDAGVAEESKLAYLIDLHNKRPEAIAKLVRDSGVDLYQIDEDKVNQYSPVSSAPSSNAIVLEDAVAEAQATPEGQRAVQIVGSVWDEDSCRAVGANPQLLKDLTNHIRTGVFDKINQVVQVERAKGNLGQLTDIDAFWQVGNYMHEQGMLNPTQGNTATGVPTNTPKPTDRAAEERRQQAAPPSSRRTSTSAAPVDNYLSMSDEEFAKQLAAGKIKFG